MDTHLIAYLWDDAPAELQAQVCTTRTPQMLWVVPPQWHQRASRGGLPLALATLLSGYAGHPWGHVERFRQDDGTLLLVIYSRPRT